MNPTDDDHELEHDITQVPGQLDIFGGEVGTPDPDWAEHFDMAEERAA